VYAHTCVGLKVRRSTGSTAQFVQLQTTFMSASLKVPLMLLQIMGIWEQRSSRQ
jgi:hypothetical protein